MKIDDSQKKASSEAQKKHFSVQFVDQIDSTNTVLKDNLSNRAHKECLVAKRQLKGRGRANRTFISDEEKGIYASFVWKMTVDQKQIAWVSLMMAVCIVEAIHELYKLDALIKWPNDILLQGKKCAGILIESAIDINKNEAQLVCGFGINIDHQEFPDSFKMKAISLEDVYETKINKDQLLYLILEKMDETLDEPYRRENLLRYQKFEYLPSDYVHIESFGKNDKAHLLGVNDLAQMQIKTQDGEFCILTSEEVHFVFDE